MAQIVKTTVSEIMAAIRSRVKAAISLQDAQILDVQREGVDLPMAFTSGPYVLFIVGDPRPESEITDSVNRFWHGIHRPLFVASRVRLDMDASQNATQRLHSATNGLFPFEHKVMDALIGYFPTNPAGDQLVVEELHMIPSPRAIELPSNPEWAQTVMVFDLHYIENIS